MLVGAQDIPAHLDHDFHAIELCGDNVAVLVIRRRGCCVIDMSITENGLGICVVIRALACSLSSARHKI